MAFRCVAANSKLASQANSPNDLLDRPAKKPSDVIWLDEVCCAAPSIAFRPGPRQKEAVGIVTGQCHQSSVAAEQGASRYPPKRSEAACTMPLCLRKLGAFQEERPDKKPTNRTGSSFFGRISVAEPTRKGAMHASNSNKTSNSLRPPPRRSFPRPRQTGAILDGWQRALQRNRTAFPGQWIDRFRRVGRRVEGNLSCHALRTGLRFHRCPTCCANDPLADSLVAFSAADRPTCRFDYRLACRATLRLSRADS